MEKRLQEIQKIQNKYLSLLDDPKARCFLNTKTLRLTKSGFTLFKSKHRNWKIQVDATINSSDLINLMRKAQAPYYITKSNVFLFSEEDAFLARLGGVKTWTQSK